MEEREGPGTPESGKPDGGKGNARSHQARHVLRDAPPRPLVGQEGQDFLLQTLSKPLKVALPAIRARTSLPASHAPTLALLEHLGVPRAEVYATLLRTAREKLLARINAADVGGGSSALLGPDRLLDLLAASFQYLGIPELRPVAVAILERLRPVPTQYLKQLAADEQMVESLPVGVRRQVWELDNALLRRRVQPLLKQFARERSSASAAAVMPFADADGMMGWRAWQEGDEPPPPMLEPRDRAAERASSPALRQLVEVVGASRRIYDSIMALCRTSYAESGRSGECALRFQLLMALRDAGASELCEGDRVYQLACCLDACARHGRIARRRMDELVEFFSGVPSGRSAQPGRNLDDRASNTNDTSMAVLGDAGMVLREPHNYNLLLAELARVVNRCADTPKLPRETNTADFLVRVLTLAGGCRKQLRSSKFAMPDAPQLVLNKTLPRLVEVLADGLAAGMEGEAAHLNSSGDDDDGGGSGGTARQTQGVAAPGGGAAAAAAVVAVFSDEMEDKLRSAGEDLSQLAVSKESLARRVAFHVGAHAAACAASSPAHVRLLRAVMRATASLDASAMAHDAAPAEAMLRATCGLVERGVLVPLGAGWEDAVAFGKRTASAGAGGHVELIRLLAAAGRQGLDASALADLLEASITTDYSAARPSKKRKVEGGAEAAAAGGAGAARRDAAVVEAYRAACAQLPQLTRDLAPVLHAYLDDGAGAAE